MRWPTVEQEVDGALFDADALADRHVGRGEFAGMEFLHVNAKTIINRVPGSSRMPFGYTINAYRGCSHACSYCLAGDTPILLADGRTRPLKDVRVGDQVYGVERRGAYLRYVPTPVLDHWETCKPAYRVVASDGTELVASGDHRFLTDRGWKHVTGAASGAEQRPYLTGRNRLIGPGRFASPPSESEEYQRGYLCGMVRGDANLASCAYSGRRPFPESVHRFRVALADEEGLERASRYLANFGVETTAFMFSPATPTRRPMAAIRTSSEENVAAIHELVRWPEQATPDWSKGFLAGIFDAEGGRNCGVLRISNADQEVIARTSGCLRLFSFDVAEEHPRQGLCHLRVRGGLAEHLRFFHLVNPAITRNLRIDQMAVKGGTTMEVVAVEPLGLELPLYDLTTGTGNFIANGVVSHNCFARPTHDYLGLGIGEDFERKIVVKVNAVERLRVELDGRRWEGHPIAMGTNTDPYQRCEGKYHLTQGIIGVLAEAANPFSILTKSTLILRDLDLLVEAARRTDVRVNLSIGTLDEEVWRLAEPGTPRPSLRVEAVRRLTEAGLTCGVLVAPILPGLSDGDDQLREVVEACVDAGAASISSVALHLRPGVRDHYLTWLRGVRPDLARTTEARYRGAYLPKVEQQALTERVRGFIDAARGAREPGQGSARGRDAGGSGTERVRVHMGGDARAARLLPPPRPGIDESAVPPSPAEQLELGW